MKDFWYSTGAAFLICAVVVLISWTTYQGGSENGYTNGYCAALGGTALNVGECNVDGSVVGVQR